MSTEKMIEKYASSHNATNIIIAGMTCSGKTTLSCKLRDYLRKRYLVTVFGQDDYFKDLYNIPRSPGGYLTDSIDAFCTEEFQRDAQKMLENGVVYIPVYDISRNTRISKNRIATKGDFNIFEGLHTIHLLTELKDSITIFIDTDVETCLQRRIKRDSSLLGVSEERIREYWEECVYPMSQKFILPQKSQADIVLKTSELI